MSSALFETIKILERAQIHFYLELTRPDSIRVSAALPGERLEIDVFEDNHVEIARFQVNEAVEGGMDLLLTLLNADSSAHPIRGETPDAICQNPLRLSGTVAG